MDPCKFWKWRFKSRAYLFLVSSILLFTCLHVLIQISIHWTEGGRMFSARPKHPAAKNQRGAEDPAAAAGRDKTDTTMEGVYSKSKSPLTKLADGLLIPGRVLAPPDQIAGSANGDVHTAPKRPSNIKADTKDVEARPWAPFPWPERRHVVANYFLHRDVNASNFHGSTDIIVYLHHNKAAGTTTKHCMDAVAGAGLGRYNGPVLNDRGRNALEAQLKSHGRLFRVRSVANTFVGGYAFGLCDRFSQPCAYFTVLRDPYERTMSSYWYCKTARIDQLCTALDANKVSLREWAIHQGNFLFRQLLFQPEFCTDSTQWAPFIQLGDVPHEFLRHRVDSLNSAPCWFRQKLIMELTLKPDNLQNLLLYCLENLDKWFAVIMLVDHYDLSLKMLSRAFDLPFYDVCNGHHRNLGNYNGSRTTVVDATAGANDTLKSIQLRELREDMEVRRILRADELLYRKGVEIFNRQRTVFENS